MRVQGPQLFAAMGLAVSVWACSATAPRQPELIVSAAISLKDPLQTLARMYEQRYATRVHLNTGASGWLSSQIERGAPVDVYASASEQYLKELEDQHLLAPGGPRSLAGNRLVLIVPRSSAFSLWDWSELRSVHDLALGNPATVPAGAYARECLRSLGLWDELRPRLVFAEHVRQVLDYVAHSEVEAGLVYATEARIVPGAVKMDLTARGDTVTADELNAELSRLEGTAPPKEANDPLHISVPTSGIHFAFEKLYANQSHQEAWFAVSYASAGGARFGQMANLLGAALFWLGIWLRLEKDRRRALVMSVVGLVVLTLSIGVFHAGATLPLAVSTLVAMVFLALRGKPYLEQWRRMPEAPKT